MGILGSTTRCKNKGIVSVSDLMDLDKDSINQITSSLQNIGGCIPNPHPGAASGATIPMPPICFGPKSQKHLLSTCDLVHFYEMVR